MVMPKTARHHPRRRPGRLRRARRTGDEIRDLLRAAIAAALGAGWRIAALSERARPGRIGRPARLRLCLGGRAPFPPRVFALARPRSVPRRPRLAHGIMQLTTNQPARWADRIAALDLVSNGRVEFGTGESASITELEPFGVNFDEKRAIWEEGIRAVIPMLTQDRVEHHDKYFD